MLHLLKKKHQSAEEGNSWERSINNAREEINELLEDHPSLKRHIPDCIDISFSRARSKASKETGLSIEMFDKVCPWTIEEILDEKQGD